MREERDAIKTIEGWRDPRRVREYLREGPDHSGRFLFNVGNGCPQRKVARLFFVFHGRILGWFAVAGIEKRTAELSLEYARQYSPPYFKAAKFLFICARPFHFIRERVFYEGFRGWRYFDFETYRNSLDAKVRI